MSKTIPADVRSFLQNLNRMNRQGVNGMHKTAERLLNQYPEPAPAPVITAETPVDYGNDTIREHAQHLVSREVYYCVSSLVSSLQSEDACAALGIDWEDVRAVCVQDDWKTPVTEYLQGADSETVADVAEYMDVEPDPELPDLCTALIAHLEDTDGWQEVADYCRLDADTLEAYEHWIVSDWFARQLEDMGEMVTRDLLGLTVWGRCTTGQSMSMDWVILTIARNNLIRD